MDQQKTESRNLEKICTESGVPQFRTNLVGSEYCMLRPSSHMVDCKYRCYHQDKNGLFLCLYERLKALEDYNRNGQD